MTIYELAKLCNVSPSTVSKALHNNASIPLITRQRILDIATEHGYMANSHANVLKTHLTHEIGIIISNDMKTSPFFYDLAYSIIIPLENNLNKNGYNIKFLTNTNSIDNNSYLNNLVNHPVDALILFGQFVEEDISKIKEHYPTVSFDLNYYKEKLIELDNDEKTFELTEHVIFNGHKKICLAIDDVNSDLTNDRINGFKRALDKHHINFDENMVYVLSTFSDNFTAISKLIKLSNHPTAILLPNDLTAIRTCNSLYRLGLQVPQDISIIGFGGIDFDPIINKRITSIKIDYQKIAEILTNTALAKINRLDFNKKSIVRSRLLLGDTSTTAKNN